MAMPTQKTSWTADMLQNLPDDGNRYEVIDGELFVSPAPSLLHQQASAVLFRLLDPYGISVGLQVLYAPAAVRSSATREVQPDVFAFLRRPGRLPDRFLEMKELCLAVEILSPSTARVDRYRKRALYQSEGVPEYWIVDVDARMTERWRPSDAEPEVLLTGIRWQPVAAHEALEVDLVAYFRAVHGDEP
jgi:Uma2 family endonuclease